MAERVAIVGSRKWADRERVRRYVAALPADSVVISGGAGGVDTIAEEAARARGLAVEVYYPDYTRYSGKAAPLIRNTTIAERCDRLVAFWNGESTGTQDAMRKARNLGKPVEVITR